MLPEVEQQAKARAAYSRYGAVVGYKNFQGNPMPTFDELPPLIQRAWVAAANETPVLPSYEKAPQTPTPAAGSEAHPAPTQPEVAPAVPESPTPPCCRPGAGGQCPSFRSCSGSIGTCPGK